MWIAYIFFLVASVLTAPKALALLRGSGFYPNYYKIQWRDLFWGSVLAIIPYVHILVFCVSICVISAHWVTYFRRPSWWRANVFPLFTRKKVVEK